MPSARFAAVKLPAFPTVAVPALPTPAAALLAPSNIVASDAEMEAAAAAAIEEEVGADTAHSILT